MRCGDGGGRPGRQIWKQATVQCPGREQNPRHGGGGSGAGGLRPVARSPGSQKGPSELRHLPVGLSSLTVVWLRGRGWGGHQGRAVAEACGSTGVAGPWLLSGSQTQRGQLEEPGKLLLKEKASGVDAPRQAREFRLGPGSCRRAGNAPSPPWPAWRIPAAAAGWAAASTSSGLLWPPPLQAV